MKRGNELLVTSFARGWNRRRRNQTLDKGLARQINCGPSVSTTIFSNLERKQTRCFLEQSLATVQLTSSTHYFMSCRPPHAPPLRLPSFEKNNNNKKTNPTATTDECHVRFSFLLTPLPLWLRGEQQGWRLPPCRWRWCRFERLAEGCVSLVLGDSQADSKVQHDWRAQCVHTLHLVPCSKTAARSWGQKVLGARPLWGRYPPYPTLSGVKYSSPTSGLLGNVCYPRRVSNLDASVRMPAVSFPIWPGDAADYLCCRVNVVTCWSRAGKCCFETKLSSLPDVHCWQNSLAIHVLTTTMWRQHFLFYTSGILLFHTYLTSATITSFYFKHCQKQIVYLTVELNCCQWLPYNIQAGLHPSGAAFLNLLASRRFLLVSSVNGRQTRLEETTRPLV